MGSTSTFGNNEMLMGRHVKNMIEPAFWVQTKKIWGTFWQNEKLFASRNIRCSYQGLEWVWESLQDSQLTTTHLIFFTQTKELVHDFLKLNGKWEGYERSRITPYMHIMVTHIQNCLSSLSLSRFLLAKGGEKQWYCSWHNLAKVPQMELWWRCSSTGTRAIASAR